MKKIIVTPWEVKGELEKLDYTKLIKKFGTKPLTQDLLEKLKKITGELHLFLRRGVFFSHRDFDWILDKYNVGEKFCLYTGRGPSGVVHLGHLIPWMFTKWLQDKFDVELYFQLTDDEKFLVKDLSLDQTLSFSFNNVLDIIACELAPEKTHIFIDTQYTKTLYKLALRIAKHLTFSTVKAVFGFKPSDNIGIIFFPAMQIAPCFLPSILKGKLVPCLIPASIDQDPYWRPARDVAPRLGFYKPAQIHSRFLPGLGRGGKMSASEPETAIFVTDSLEVVERKILNAFDGGQPTLREQKEKGGNPDICLIYQYFYFLFEPNDKKIENLKSDCKNGKLVCGECKQKLATKVKEFLAGYQQRREKAKNIVDKFILKD
ncbi:MAG: tryptophan--tRNA ligase [Candidatus Aenigmarchaeota archaeon]|nr:tryptophan--tRNA ligase [Candidatus Aenigmarchaeota archaeon]